MSLHKILFLISSIIIGISAGEDLRAEPVPDKKPSYADALKEAKKIPWLSDLKAAHQQALTDRKPVFIFLSAKRSAPCRKMAMEMETSAVQSELARWIPVYLDIDLQLNDAETLAVSSVPSLRIITPGGEQKALRDGYLSAEDLVVWLKKYYDEAMAPVDDMLLEATELDATTVEHLVGLFQRRDPAIREAAIRRLSTCPKLAQPAAVKAFLEGNLSIRLSALELLNQWKAPVDGLDPWRPETLTDKRIQRLKLWTIDDENQSRIAEQKELSSQQRSAARQDIARMLKADDVESSAICHRLAGCGSALLPDVYELLKEAASDQDRQRLLILRYRLVAPDSLVLRWPGGLARLAVTDPRERQEAAEELVNLAASTDQPLLLELFSDPDPLVREISLRGLQKIGGKESNAALVKLLADPEPNVRTAVLKQLEENPDPEMVPAIVSYLQGEKDPDLIVHAICFLKVSKQPEAIKCMMSLLKHESWQVRSEAASGIGKLVGEIKDDSPRRNTSGVDSKSESESQADAYMALIELLDDSDAFVVAKAVEGLANADMAVAVEPLVKAAAKHPQLAASVFSMLVSSGNMSQKAIPHLRKFCTDKDPSIRATALDALCSAASYDIENEVQNALNDDESIVRIAAATSIFKLLEQQRNGAWQQMKNGNSGGGYAPSYSPQPAPSEGVFSTAIRFFFSGTTQPPSAAPAITLDKAEKQSPMPTEINTSNPPAEPQVEDANDSIKADGNQPVQKTNDSKSESDEPDPWDQWLEKYYAGHSRPKWMINAIGPLEKMLAAESSKERITAAVTLIPLGKMDLSMPVINDLIQSNPEHLEIAQAILPWLTGDRRIKFYHSLNSLAKSEETSLQLIRSISRVTDRRTAELLWDILAEEKITTEKASVILEGLREAYLGNRYYAPSEIPASKRKDLVRDAKPRTESGTDMKRLAALALLASVAKDDAAEAASRLANDSQLSEASRLDAFQVFIITQPRKEALETVVTAIRGDNIGRKNIALKYLVHGPNGLQSLKQGIYLYGSFESISEVRYGDDKQIIPTPPKGVNADDIIPLLNDSDPEMAAGAAYLLALFGNSDGMDKLLAHWKKQPKKYNQWSQFVYRAIAVLDDPKYIPILIEIYSNMEEYEVREFYWTIRIMSGPEILKFRKQIRDERGMSQLQ